MHGKLGILECNMLTRARGGTFLSSRTPVLMAIRWWGGGCSWSVGGVCHCTLNDLTATNEIVNAGPP